MVGVIIDKYGRRSALLISILPSIVGWFILYLNLNIWSSIVGQMLNGLMLGAVGYPSQVYAGECIMVNNTSLRNSFLSWIALSNAFGMFLVYVLGYFMTYQNIALVAFLLSFISFLLTFFCIPESPSWLHLKRRKGDAEWSQKKLGLCYPLLENLHPQHNPVVGENVELSPFHSNSLKKIKRKDVWKPMLLGSMLTVLLSLSGGMPVLTYMVQVIGNQSDEMSKNGNLTVETVPLLTTNLANVGVDQWTTNLTAGNHTLDSRSFANTNSSLVRNLPNETIQSSKLNQTNTHMLSSTFPYGLSIISGAIILIANILMSLLLPYLGVKKILIYPFLGMAVGMLIEGLTSDFKSDPLIFGIHVGAVWLVTFTFTFSLLIIPDSMLGDLFPVDAKGYASIPFLFEGFVTAVMCKAHPHLHQAGGGVIFFFYSLICLISAIFVSLFIPEIVGKTLKQINNEFL